MKNLLKTISLVPLAMTLSATTAATDDGEQCKGQAEQILDRLQAEVVGELSVSQRASANQIVLDVCLAREQQVEIQEEKAVQQAREEEQAKANDWFTESPDKPGNKRLKRKGH
jgi:hypothetical protein